jgi:8-oxo-dGTP diphosphatase
MWPDDRHWMPLMLAGQSFSGRFLFDTDRMLDHEVTPATQADAPQPS